MKETYRLSKNGHGDLYVEVKYKNTTEFDYLFLVKNENEFDEFINKKIKSKQKTIIKEVEINI